MPPSGRRMRKFARRLQGLILDLLSAEAVDVVQTEFRAKTVDSFQEKVRRKGRPTEGDALSSVTDLVGLRIITYYLEDVEKVGGLLASEFEVDKNHSADKAEVLASDQFGYRSAHYVVRLKSSRSALPEWRPFADIAVEIQVRTALQHAWAAVSHKLEYKSPGDAPASLRRRLFRLSALFEMADEQFAILRDESQATNLAYRAEVSKGQLDVPIDASSVGAYMAITGRHQVLVDLFEERGFKTERSLPVDEERLNRDRSDLVTILKDNGMATLADLDSYLQDQANLVAVLDVLKQETDDPESSVDDLLTQLVLCDRDKSETPGEPIYLDRTVKRLARTRDKLAERRRA